MKAVGSLLAPGNRHRDRASCGSPKPRSERKNSPDRQKARGFERFFALLIERALKRGVLHLVAELEKAIKAYIDHQCRLEAVPMDQDRRRQASIAFARSPQTNGMKPTSESEH
jgi:hypothetical protein